MVSIKLIFFPCKNLIKYAIILISMTKKPFYSSGLYFSCKRCSACCRYEAGFVFLSEKDLDKLSGELKMDCDRFTKIYCRWVIDWFGKEVLSLKEKANKDCIFWDSGCTVYNARPLQCRTYPFWESIVASAKSWEVTASDCPGINTGTLYTGKAIDENIKLRDHEPIINKRYI